jgi:hypothetical protein
MAGRAITQAVIRWLPNAAARVRARSVHVGFVVDKVALGQVFSDYLGFRYQSSFHQILHSHNHPGQVQQANWWPTCRVDPVGLHPPLFELKKSGHGIIEVLYQNLPGRLRKALIIHICLFYSYFLSVGFKNIPQQFLFPLREQPRFTPIQVVSDKGVYTE